MNQTLKVPAVLSGGVLLVLVAFYWPFLSGQGSFFLSDATFWLEPQARYLRESIWSGRFPLWNPWNYCGMPQIAIPFPSLFYLPDWLFVLFPFNPALALSMIFHQLLALLGMYAMLRNFKMSETGSAGGAIIYSLSGYMFGLSNNHSLVAGAAWFPILFLTLLKVVSSDTEKIRFKYCLASSLCLLMIIASGRPEVFVPSIFISAAFALYKVISGIKAKTIEVSSLIWLFRSLFLGVVFSMPIILPMGEWLASSRRALGLNSFEVFLYSANWYDIVSSVIGPALGDLRLHGNPYRTLVSFSNLPAYIACSYIGPIAAALALLGANDKTWTILVRLSIVCLMILSIIASLGDTTSIPTSLLHVLPVLGFIRFPVKLLFIGIWCVAILAARGIECIKGQRISNTIPTVFICLISLSALILKLSGRNNILLFGFKYPDSNISNMLSAQDAIAHSLLITTAIVLAFTGCTYALKKNPQGASSICLIALLGTLTLNAFSLERIFAPPDHFDTPSFVAEKILKENQATESLVRNRVLNLTYERFTVPQMYQSSNNLQRTIGELQYHRQILRPNTNVDFNFPEGFGFEGSMNGEFFNVFYNSYFKSNQTIRPEINPTSNYPLQRFASVCSCDYLISQIFRMNQEWQIVDELLPSEFEKMVEDLPHNVRIYKNKNAIPRLFLSYNWIPAKTHNEVLEAIVSSSQKGWLPWQTPYIEHAKSIPKTFEPKGSIIVRSEIPEKLCIEVTSNSSGYLIVSDRFYPGWKAKLDGTEMRISVANAFFRAIPISQGKHMVTFEYGPQSLYLGLVLFFLGWLLTLHLFCKINQQKDGVTFDTTNASGI